MLGLVGGPFMRSTNKYVKVLEEGLGNLFICFSSKSMKIELGLRLVSCCPLFYNLTWVVGLVGVVGRRVQILTVEVLEDVLGTLSIYFSSKSMYV